MKVLLCSTSTIKIQAVTEFFKEKEIKVDIDTFNCDSLGLPLQPIDSSTQCAQMRLDYARENINQNIKENAKDKYDYYIAVENGLNLPLVEECCVMIERKGVKIYEKSFCGIPTIYRDVYDDLKNEYMKNLKESSNKLLLGHNITLGEMIHKMDSSVDPKNWTKNCGYDRVEMIKDALKIAFAHLEKELNSVKQVIAAYKTYPDFPKPGVLFQDIFAVLADPTVTKTLCKIMKNRYASCKVDYIVGLESRGFFGILLAKELEVGFIPIRKKGKLPGPVERVNYGTEYSQDTCEISTSIPENSNVIIFDDLIATGGSIQAAIILLTKMKSRIVDICVLREVVSLRNKAEETLGRKYTVLLQD